MKTDKRGFTLLELVIAALLLVTVCAGILSAFFNAMRLVDPKAGLESLFARERLERLYEYVRHDWWSTSTGPLSVGNYPSDGTRSLPNGKTLSRSYVVTAVDVNGDAVADYRRVVTQVTSS